jgi:hypothetical protein
MRLRAKYWQSMSGQPSAKVKTKPFHAQRWQAELLGQFYNSNQHPSDQERAKLALDTGLYVHQPTVEEPPLISFETPREKLWIARWFRRQRRRKNGKNISKSSSALEFNTHFDSDTPLSLHSVTAVGSSKFAKDSQTQCPLVSKSPDRECPA